MRFGPAVVVLALVASAAGWAAPGLAGVVAVVAAPPQAATKTKTMADTMIERMAGLLTRNESAGETGRVVGPQ